MQQNNTSSKPSWPYAIFRPLLFQMSPEAAHHFVFYLLNFARFSGIINTLKCRDAYHPVEAMGLTFPNPLGLAAGMDKNAEVYNAMFELGFGAVEVGTITPQPQPGNPQPRLFRIPLRQALINRMGFNNDGAGDVLERIPEGNHKGILGINIGKQKTTPIEEAHGDYRLLLRRVYPHADYVAVNISSPNTPNLRQLQEGKHLAKLMQMLKLEQSILADKYETYKPIAIKVAPDLSRDTILYICDLLIKHGMDGLIATNTTIARDGIDDLPISSETGGLSGLPVREKATEVIRQFHEQLKDDIPIIGVGGIMTGKDAREKLEAGARLIQIYTGFVYKGPALIKEIMQEIKA